MDRGLFEFLKFMFRIAKWVLIAVFFAGDLILLPYFGQQWLELLNPAWFAEGGSFRTIGFFGLALVDLLFLAIIVAGTLRGGLIAVLVNLWGGYLSGEILLAFTALIVSYVFSVHLDKIVADPFWNGIFVAGLKLVFGIPLIAFRMTVIPALFGRAPEEDIAY